ncbi:hypothetical protein KEM55_008762 [Ascosphaera atra]|nr:hypothetical protein KEM55_008762 [Ascosphaera atra]
MIIYKDIITGDELMSDTYKIQQTPGGCLWEIDCKKYVKGKTNVQLEGANPSAEGGDDDDEGEGSGEMIHDIEESFQLQWLKPDENGMETKPSKEDFKANLKSYIKRINKKLQEKGDEAAVKEFQAGAGAAMKKIIANYDNYDVMMGASMDPNGMYVLIDFREDGMTPFATIWKHGLEEMKV